MAATGTLAGIGGQKRMNNHFSKYKRPLLPVTKDYREFDNVRLHRIRAQKALGRELKGTERVHHLDGSKTDDAPLVICPDEAYHKLLHMRAKVLAAGGNPDTQKVCNSCGRPKDFIAFEPHRRKDRPAGGLARRCIECSMFGG
jgi:hypothetical protein